MKVYLLETDYGGWDSYEGAVIIAESEEEAREIAKNELTGGEQDDYIEKVHQKLPTHLYEAERALREFKEKHPEVNVWTDKNASACRVIGESVLKAQLVLSSYHGG